LKIETGESGVEVLFKGILSAEMLVTDCVLVPPCVEETNGSGGVDRGGIGVPEETFDAVDYETGDEGRPGTAPKCALKGFSHEFKGFAVLC
jgi:hypothetical protein